MKRAKITKPSGRKPMRIGAILLKEVPYKDEWRIDLTWRDPGKPPGKERCHRTRRNWRHAEEFAAKENKRLELLKEKGAGRHTFNDAADSYIKKYEDRSKAKDSGGYSGCTRDSFMTLQSIVENHLRPRFGHMRLAEISSRHIEDWITEQAKIAKPRTLKLRMGELNRVLSHAVDREMLLVTPKKVRVPGKILKRAKIPDRSDLEMLREYLMGPRPLKHGRFAWSCRRMIVLFAVSCGLRAGEMSALEWDDIDRETGEIDINKARAHYQGLKGPKTEAGYRKLPTTPATREIINEHAEVYKQFYGKCVGPVLKSREKDYLAASEVSRVFRETMRECGLADPNTNQIKFTTHAGRHWTASHWLKSTADVHQSTKWMGHKNPSMTLDIYGHCLDDPESRAKFERMPDWLIPTIESDSPSALPPVENSESLRALPAPEDSFEFGPKANGQVEPEHLIDVPDIAEPWVKPFLKLLQQGMKPADAYFEIAPLMPNLRSTKNPTVMKWATVLERICAEFKRLKLPEPRTIASRIRAEKILKLHGEKYQVFEIAKLVGCEKSTVNNVLRSRHKGNANNPLNRKANMSVNLGRKPQPEHKKQLKLL